MAGDREKRQEELNELIASIDSGIIQVVIHKGMPVKVHLVSNQEIIIGGGKVDSLNTIEWFTSRNWWKKE